MAVSGTCRVTATAIDGGITIDISKGRLEGHGSPNGGFDNLLTACGASPGSLVIGGGAVPAGKIEISISAVADAAPAAPSAVNVPQCTDASVKLVEYDCNVVLVGLGGGIAGAMETLRVGATATAVNGNKYTGTTINISKGLLEGHGSPNGGFDNLLTACGASTGSLVIGRGAVPTGISEIPISAA
ncbi:hypothetical protein DFH08DRAFT_963728 [Mycena albidolilacea]|uniref:Uncharacterized protein n=1 Tax=Mycena albidolilacea TaxID=1033008 RepID=A0AAD7EP57_9AGAR|nr:hypothetical protein DFH08DRAFT_963728 [Mycena albidolilacea]